MGLTSWIKKQIQGDPEDAEFRKEMKAEEKKAFQEQYRISALEAAKERGKAKAERLAKKGSQGSGILNTLGNIGEKMGKASEGLVKGIEINPNGANETFNVNDPFTPTYNDDYPRSRRRRKSSSLQTVDPFDTEEFR